MMWAVLDPADISRNIWGPTMILVLPNYVLPLLFKYSQINLGPSLFWTSQSIVAY